MLSKTRTTIITLVAAFSFAGAAIVPAAAQASKSQGCNSACQRALKQKVVVEFCNDEWSSFWYDSLKGDSFWNAGDKVTATLWYVEAGKQWDAAKEHGCAWAASERLPKSPTSGIVPPVVGGIYVAPTPRITPTIPIPPPAK